jgi:hypothetical protein
VGSFDTAPAFLNSAADKMRLKTSPFTKALQMVFGCQAALGHKPRARMLFEVLVPAFCPACLPLFPGELGF